MCDIEPGYKWYINISKKKRVQERCPHTDQEICPRYYFSLVSLEIKSDIDAIRTHLSEHWKRSFSKGLRFPVPDVRWGNLDDEREILSAKHLCPEVMYEKCNKFVEKIKNTKEYSKIGERANPITGVREIGEYGSFMELRDQTPMHYTDCPLYKAIQKHTFPEPEPPENPNLILLSGYYSVKWTNPENPDEQVVYDLNKNQAKIVETLHLKPDYQLHVRTLLEETCKFTAEELKMHRYFPKDKGRGKLIVSVPNRRGYWKLNI